MKRNDSGITLIVLVLIIIILIIIASISIYEGKELIAKSKVQTLETNMLTIQAKSKAYAEEIDAKIWTENDKDLARNTEFANKGFENPSSSLDSKYGIELTDYISYTIEEEALSAMGLDDIKNEKYIVVYAKNDYNKIDIIYVNGVKYKKVTYYTLSNLKNALSNESNN